MSVQANGSDQQSSDLSDFEVDEVLEDPPPPPTRLPERLRDDPKSISTGSVYERLGIKSWDSSREIADALSRDLSKLVRERPPVNPSPGTCHVYLKNENESFHRQGEPWKLDCWNWRCRSTKTRVHGIKNRHCLVQTDSNVFNHDFKLTENVTIVKSG
eukprot:768733_1